MTTENPYSPPGADLADNEPSELAGRGRRLAGAIIDTLAILVVTVPLMLMTGYFQRASTGDQSLTEMIFLGFAGMVAFLVFNGYLLKTRGQTIGKRVLGTQIVSVEDNSLLPIGKLIGLRYLPLWLVSQVPVIGQLAGLVNALFIFRSDKRCVHDLIAGTKVINYRAV